MRLVLSFNIKNYDTNLLSSHFTYICILFVLKGFTIYFYNILETFSVSLSCDATRKKNESEKLIDACNSVFDLHI